MALTHEKTWNFDVNNVITASGTVLTDNQNMLFAIKSAVVSLGTNPWTVAGSSNGSAAGMDATDRWLSAANLVWGASGAAARSWIVFERVGGDQFLIDLQATTNGTRAVRAWSPGGLYTGGTTTAAPTATDEIVLANSTTNWATGHGTSQTHVIHVMHSDDGKLTFWVINYNNLTQQIYMFCDLEDANPGMSYPTVLMFDPTGGTADWATVANLFDSQSHVFGAKNDNLQWTGALTSEHLTSSLLNELVTVNSFDSKTHLTPIRVASTQAGAAGSHGRVPDMFMGPITAGTGDQHQDTGVTKFVQFGVIALPFPPSTAPVTA